jgi:uncharacterized protein YbjQ (UPF0145 family)
MNMHRDKMTTEKNINLMNDETTADLVVEEQIARNITELLKGRAQHLLPEQEQRLSNARSMAVNYLAEQQAQLAVNHDVNQHGHALRWFGQRFDQHRFASSALIVVVMLLTFFAVQHFGLNNNLENSDAFLLAADLPPEAYADKGFDAWLDSN